MLTCIIAGTPRKIKLAEILTLICVLVKTHFHNFNFSRLVLCHHFMIFSHNFFLLRMASLKLKYEEEKNVFMNRPNVH